MNWPLSLLLCASLLALSYEGKLWSEVVRDGSRNHLEEVRMQAKIDSMGIVVEGKRKTKEQR